MTQLLMWWCIGGIVGTVVCMQLSRRWRGSVLLALCTVVCVAIASVTAALALALRTYTTLTSERPVAVISCEPLPGNPPRFLLHYAPQQPRGQATQTFELMGDQWTVSGEFLKWHPWLTVLGWQAVHKPTRVSGRFLRTHDERAQPPTVFDLNGGTDPWWIWLHQHGQWLPFVEAVYGTGVYTFAEPGRQHTLYVTPSGYLVK